MNVPCENCGKNVLGKIGFAVETGLVTVSDDCANFNSGMMMPEEVKGDGFLCSFKCLREWINKQRKLTLSKCVLKDLKDWKKEK